MPRIATDGSYRVEAEDLDRAACLRLLAEGSVGRVICTCAALPAAYPVAYLLDGEAVLFRALPGGRLASVPRSVVAFQVDDVDDRTGTGWSVLGIGEAAEVADPDRLAALAGRLPDPWLPLPRSPDSRLLIVSVPLQRLTGRRVRRLG